MKCGDIMVVVVNAPCLFPSLCYGRDCCVAAVKCVSTQFTTSIDINNATRMIMEFIYCLVKLYFVMYCY